MMAETKIIKFKNIMIYSQIIGFKNLYSILSFKSPSIVRIVPMIITLTTLLYMIVIKLINFKGCDRLRKTQKAGIGRVILTQKIIMHVRT